MYPTMCKKQISKAALEHNINILTKNLPSYLCVVKSNAYGHGLCEVAQMCLEFESASKLYAFAVGTCEEALLLRKKGIKEDIVVLLGAVAGKYEEEVRLVKENNLTLVVHDEDCLRIALEANISFAIKWDTGMNRIGFTEEDMPALLDILKNKKEARLELSVSHFAIPDNLDPHALSHTKAQLEKFNSYTQRIKELFPHIKSSLGQSAFTLANEMPVSDIARLGVSMYGANPFYGTPWVEKGEMLKAVMQLSAPILNVRKLKAHEGIGYGLRDKSAIDREVAVVGIGYDEGYRRLTPSPNSPRVQALYKGKRVDLLGVVCMQACFFDVTGLGAKAGDEVFLLGGGDSAISAEELSSWWNTIPYEVICQLGKTSQIEIIK